jgi:hypothetical protein
VTRAALAAWDERSPDSGANRAARLAALAEVERFVARYEPRSEAARLVVHAAHTAAQLRRAAGDRQAAAWCRRALRAFERYRASAPNGATGSAEAELAASCASADLDEALRADFGPPSPVRRYGGDQPAVERAFRADLARADVHDRRVRDLAERFGSRAWFIVSRARQAALADAFRAGLAAASSRTGAGGLESALREAEERAVRAQVEVVLLARAFHVGGTEVVETRRRLAALARLLGDATLRAMSTGLMDPATQAPFVYQEGMFAGPPGMTAEGTELLAPPLPVLP